jgi:hypothetical protein
VIVETVRRNAIQGKKTKATRRRWLLKWGGFITTEVDPSACDHETGLLFAFSRMHLQDVHSGGQGADVDAAQVLTGLGIGNGSIRLKISVWAWVSADTNKAPARAAVRNSFKPLFIPPLNVCALAMNEFVFLQYYELILSKQENKKTTS